MRGASAIITDTQAISVIATITITEKPYRSLSHESTPSIVSEENWDTKEDKGKSMMCALCVLWLVEKHISERSDVEQ